MTREDLIKGIIRISEKLDNSEGFNALLEVKEMQALVDRYDEEKEVSIESTSNKFNDKLRESQTFEKIEEDAEFNHTIVFESNQEEGAQHIAEFLKQIGFNPRFVMTVPNNY